MRYKVTRQILFSLFLAPFALSAQIDTMPVDSVNLPFYEMTNYGVEKWEYFQYNPRFVVVTQTGEVVGANRFATYGDSTRIDTIVVKDASLFRTEDDGTVKSICGYSGNQKHRDEIVYYEISDLRGVVITGRNFRIKYSGQWKHGQKNGEWRYYSPNGELQRIERWKNGKLKWSEDAK